MVFVENGDSTMTYDRDFMMNELFKRECNVIFTKVNGETRDMKCTLREDVIPEVKSSATGGYANPEVIRAFDTNKNEWRSFRVANVVSFN